MIAGPVPADADSLRRLYESEVGAYMEGLAVAPPATIEILQTLRTTLNELDPGRPLVVDALSLPEPASEALADAARLGAAGASLTLFMPSGAGAPTTGTTSESAVDASRETLMPFVVLAREFQGDLSYDPGYGPEGTGVKGEPGATSARTCRCG